MNFRIWSCAIIFTIGLVLIGYGSYLFYQFHHLPQVKSVLTPSPIIAALIPQPSPSPQPIKLLFGGDLMFDRHIRKHMTENGTDFILSSLVPFLASYDGVIANLEGPITSNPSRSLGSEVGSTNNFIFTFDPQIADLLKKSHFTLVNLGNNHIRNFEDDGVAQTKANLSRAGVRYFGDSATEKNSAERIAIEVYQGTSVAFVNYNQFVERGWTDALADIAYVKPHVQLVVVYTHWGIEYLPAANQVIQNQAHELVDAGADVVIGSHPHVVEQHEDYHGKRIYYSLGNFVFDQYFSPEVQTGLLVEMDILEDKTLRFKEIPITLLTNGQTVLTK